MRLAVALALMLATGCCAEERREAIENTKYMHRLGVRVARIELELGLHDERPRFRERESVRPVPGETE